MPDTIACIIPAHNEQDRIVQVVYTAIESGLFDRITVVDDASDDYTVFGLESLFIQSKITVLRRPYHVGKSRAVAYAFARLPRCKFVCLLDADLIGLRPEDLHNLVHPVVLGNASVSISRRG